MYTALRLQRTLAPEIKRGTAEVVVVTPDPYMTYKPFLPEAAAGSISPAMSSSPCAVSSTAAVSSSARPTPSTTPNAPPPSAPSPPPRRAAGTTALTYDELVLAPGSVSRTLPVPGLAEHGIGFRTVEEAIGLRNHVIEQMDIASSTRDPAIRDAALTFVFVGGGYAGVEALGELEDMARYTARYYRNITPDDMKWVLVEASDRILPEVDAAMGAYTLSALRRRGVDVRLRTRLDSCADRVATLSDGTRFPTRTLVWTGRASNPTRCSPPPTFPSPTTGASGAPPTSPSKASPTPGAPVTPPPSPTSPPPAPTPRPTRSTPCARPASSATTSPPPSTSARSPRTSTAVRAPSPHSASTKASPRSADASSRATLPG